MNYVIFHWQTPLLFFILLILSFYLLFTDKKEKIIIRNKKIKEEEIMHYMYLLLLYYKKEFKEESVGGLCSFLKVLLDKKVINSIQYRDFKNALYDNRPTKEYYIKRKLEDRSDNAYFFEPENYYQRFKWLKQYK